MPKRKEPTKAQILKEIKQEIEHYRPKKSIADLMLKLGNLGFEFSGHGCGMGGEDFSLIKYYKHHTLHFAISDMGRTTRYFIYKQLMGDDGEFLNEHEAGTSAKAMKLLLEIM